MKYACVLLLVTTSLFAQTSDEITFQRTFLLRNVSGTAFNPGPAPWHPHIVNRGAWTTFWGGSVFATYASATGPKVAPSEFFSTNWFSAGAQRPLGSRALLVFRGRASLEPYTIKKAGYPQLLQWISPENGGPLLDAMRAHDLVGEAAVDLAFRVTTNSFVHLYAAPVGDPAFGAVPYALRTSAEEFAEAPLAYDVQETAHPSTNVVTAGFGSRWVAVDASVFHNAVSRGRHTSFDSGGAIDSHAARLTITPTRNLALQVSRASLGDADLAMSSASLTYGNGNAALSAIWTQRETPAGEKLTSGTLEGTLRIARSTLSGRAELADRPRGFLDRTDVWRTTHYTVGYIFDVVASAYRVGIGANVDYQTQYRELPPTYGHKPQTLYAFVRVRTDSRMR
ncbi:MAG TPA: hypothetical protein VLU46_10615 [Thermoanaerobaculia bacterium]|nr:hypothetical protein [Thermoanaerobaculia bacterium]